MINQRKLMAYVVSLLFLSIAPLSAMDPSEAQNRSSPHFKPADQQTLTDEECLEIYSMYAEMQERYFFDKDELDRPKVPVCTLAEQHELSCEDPRTLIRTLPAQHKLSFEDSLTLIRKLTITCPMSHIRNVFKNYGVLQLRPLKGDMALIGCGNSPIEKRYEPADSESFKCATPFSKEDQVLGCLRDHIHEGYDTINPELIMNPTLVAAFGIDNLEKVMPRTYRKVSYEGTFASGFPDAIKAFNFHFSNARVYEMTVNAEDVRETVEVPFANLEALLASYEQRKAELKVDESDSEYFLYVKGLDAIVLNNARLSIYDNYIIIFT